jgi:hypothetical protein
VLFLIRNGTPNETVEKLFLDECRSLGSSGVGSVCFKHSVVLIQRTRPYRWILPMSWIKADHVHCTSTRYFTWAGQIDEAARAGLARQQFAHYDLMRLVIGQDRTRIALDPKSSDKKQLRAKLSARFPKCSPILVPVHATLFPA